MDKSQHQNRSQLFTVRLWLEELGAGQSEWRGQVQHVPSGETRYFREWAAVVEFVTAMLPGRGPGRDGDDASLRTEGEINERERRT